MGPNSGLWLSPAFRGNDITGILPSVGLLEADLQVPQVGKQKSAVDMQIASFQLAIHSNMLFMEQE